MKGIQRFRADFLLTIQSDIKIKKSSFMRPWICIHFIVNFLSVTVRFTVIRSVFAIEAFYKISVSIFRFHGPV